jgi:dihydrofolate reductase
MPTVPPPLALVAAVAANGVIGRENALPWRIPQDLKRFRRLTSGHRIVMGRKTYESIGRSLPERENVVVTRDPAFQAPGCRVAHSLDEALAGAPPDRTVFCIGGAQLYREALPRASILHLTEIERDFPGDAFFPPFDRGEWREESRETYTVDGPEPFQYHFAVYRRVLPGEG